MDSYGIKKSVDQLGRITLPASFRKDLNLALGDEVTICLIDDGILVKPTAKTVEVDKDAD